MVWASGPLRPKLWCYLPIYPWTRKYNIWFKKVTQGTATVSSTFNILLLRTKKKPLPNSVWNYKNLTLWPPLSRSGVSKATKMCSANIYCREIIQRLGRKGICAQAPTGQTGLGLAGVRTPLSLNVLQLETNEKINPFTSKLFQEISSVI